MVARCGFIVAVSFVTAVLAGCGSQQATPLSIAKTEPAFSAAGIPLQASEGTFFIPKGTQIARLPRALTWGEAESLVLVYRLPPTLFKRSEDVGPVRRRMWHALTTCLSSVTTRP